LDKSKARFLYIIVVALWILFAYLAIDEPIDAIISGTVSGIFVAASLINFAAHILKTDKERFHAYGWLVSAFVYGIYLTVLYKGDTSKIFSFNTITIWFLFNYLVGSWLIGSIVIYQYEKLKKG